MLSYYGSLAIIKLVSGFVSNIATFLRIRLHSSFKP